MTTVTTGQLALLLPDDWVVIDLADDAARVAAVEDIVGRRKDAMTASVIEAADLLAGMTSTRAPGASRHARPGGPVDAAGTAARLARMCDAVRVDLLAMTAQAAAAGGTLMAIAAPAAGVASAPASLTVYRQPGSLDGGAEAPLVQALLAAHEPDQALDLADGEAGTVLRRVRTTTSRPAPGAEPVRSLTVDYWAEPEPGGGLVYLVFSSPVPWERESLVELFDAVVGSLRVLQPSDAHASPVL